MFTFETTKQRVFPCLRTNWFSGYIREKTFLQNSFQGFWKYAGRVKSPSDKIRFYDPGEEAEN